MKKPQGLSEALNRRTNNILQNTTQKTKYRATQTLLKQAEEFNATKLYFRLPNQTLKHIY